MYGFFKWILDRILAFLALVILSPLIIVLTIVVAVDSPGCPFIIQKREGYKKKTIRVIKFRTMYKGPLPEGIEADGLASERKIVTRVGRFLRRVKLDELPQLWNILIGDMSFVGPRPLITFYANGVEIPHRRDRGAPLASKYKEYEYWEFRKFAVYPGLTGLPQVMGNCFLTMEERSYYDVLYTEKRSLWLDIKIFFKTIGVMIRGEKPYLKAPTREEINALIDRYQAPKGVIRVAEVIGNAKIGGVKSVVMNYLDHMETDGLDVHIFTYGPSEADKLFTERGWTVHYLPNFIHFPRAMRAFRRELRARKFNIVHSHLTSLSVFPLRVAREQGVEVRICHAHSTTSPKESVSVVKNFLARFSTKHATDLLACSERSAKWLYRKNAKKAIILKNAVDLECFTFDPIARAEVRNALGVENGTLLVGCIARFEVQKNLACLIEAVAQAAKKKDVKLLLVGGGKQGVKLMKRAVQLGISDRVIFAGETDEPWRYYSAMDVFALPSLYEGLPVVAIEAQAAGLPCILSDAITRECAVASNVDFIPPTPSAFCKAILQVVAERKENVALLREAGYDIIREAPHLRQIYEDAIKEATDLLHSQKRTLKIGNRKRTFYVSGFAPWSLLVSIMSTDYPLDKYFEEKKFYYKEMISDFHKDRPEEYERMISDSEDGA